MGDDNLPHHFEDDVIKILNEIVVEADIIDDMYGKIENLDDLHEICILSTKNEYVDELN